MFNILLLVLISFANAQNTCSAAREFRLPNFETTITFGTNTTTSEMIPMVGERETIKAFYYKVTPTRDAFVNINTCYNKTNIGTEVYLYKDCEEGIVASFVAKSGTDPECESGFNFPSLNYPLKKDETYFFVIKTLELEDVGTVKFAIVENLEDNSNVECNLAREIPSFPYIAMGTIKNAGDNTVPLDCLEEPMQTLWFKFKGDGRYYVATTCNGYTNFDTRIVVVNTTTSTGKCAGQKCVKNADNGCGKSSAASATAFYAAEGVYYYIGVTSADGSTGQFHLRMDTVADSVPAVCEKAITIKELPFGYSLELYKEWPATEAKCINNRRGQEYKTMYFTYTGEDKVMVMSTCKSLDTDLKGVGVGIELISNCADNECSVSDGEYGSCGKNMFISKKFNKGETYYIKVFCLEGACEITFNMYERTEDHSTCDKALILSSPDSQYTEIMRTQNMTKSAHGCNGVVQYDTGLWYNFVKTPQKAKTTYTIIAGDESRDRNAYIEFSPGCNDIHCEAVVRGEAHLSFDSKQENQYIYIFVNDSQKGMYVQFIQDYFDKFDTCDTALPITLPYTALHTLGTDKTDQKCLMTKNIANYYKFKLDKDVAVDVTTCFPKTTIDTAIQITRGGCKGSQECVGWNTEGKMCQVGAAKMSLDLKKNIEYTLSVYAENPNSIVNIKQYRLVAFALETPEESRCDKAIEINLNNFYEEHLMLNRLSYPTDLGEVAESVRGAYYVLRPEEDHVIQVRTCSSNTTMHSMIIVTEKCKTRKNGTNYVSYPTEVLDATISTLVSCDVYGTYSEFNATAGKTYYVFVGPEYFLEEGFIGVEFYMDPADGFGDDDDSISTAWIIFGVLLYVLLFVVICAVAVIIFLRKRSTSGGSYSTLA